MRGDRMGMCGTKYHTSVVFNFGGVNLYIVDGSIRKVAAPGVIVRLQIKHIYVRTIYVAAFLLSESPYDETEIEILPKRGAASMEHARGVPKSQLLLMKSAYRMRCITKRTPPKLEFTVVTSRCPTDMKGLGYV